MNGGINKYLLRPTRYLWNKWVFTISDQVISIFYSIFALLIMFPLFKNYLVWPRNIEQGLLVLLFVIFSFLLSFLINCVVGVLSFWLLETHSLAVLLNMSISVLSGGIFPIDMLTSQMKIIFSYLPFRFLAFIPAQIYLGKMSGEAIRNSINICIIWIIVLIVVLNNLWKKGIRRYSAFGG